MTNFDKGLLYWDEDEEESLPYFKLALEEGRLESAYYLSLGYCYKNNYVEGLKYFKLAPNSNKDEINDMLQALIISLKDAINDKDYCCEEIVSLLLIYSIALKIGNADVRSDLPNFNDLLFSIKIALKKRDFTFSDLEEIKEAISLCPIASRRQEVLDLIDTKNLPNLINNFTNVSEYNHIIDLIEKNDNKQYYRDQLNYKVGTLYLKGFEEISQDLPRAIFYFNKINELESVFMFRVLFEDTIDSFLKYLSPDEVLSNLTHLKFVRYLGDILSHLHTINAKHLISKCNFEKAFRELKLVLTSTRNDEYIDCALALMINIFDNNRDSNILIELCNYYSRPFVNNKLKNIFKNMSVSERDSNRIFYETYFYVNYPEAYETISHVDLRASNHIESKDSNTIFYFTDYFPSEMKNYNEATQNSYETIISVKKGEYSFFRKTHDRVKNFPYWIKKEFDLIPGQWIICFPPCHNDISNNSNHVFDVIKDTYLSNRFRTNRNIFLRKTCTEKKNTSESHLRKIDVDIENTIIKEEFSKTIHGENFIVIDDIDTTGKTLVACRALLKYYGANKVILLSLSRTKNGNR